MSVRCNVEEIVSLEESLSLEKTVNITNHRNYVNPGLTKLLGLLSFDKPFDKAEGMYVWDRDGKQYLDFLGGYGSLNLGHNPPSVIAAIHAVAGMPNLLQAALNPLAGALAKNLAILTPGLLQHTFFCNSGTEAVEGAVKTARIATGKTKLVYCKGAFHGKTMGALAVTGRKHYQEAFAPMMPDCDYIPFGDAAALEEKLNKGDIAAFITEPIQGEGGIICPDEGFLREARDICDKYGVLLIVDEIQSGFGRTGKMFACDHEEIAPDIMCLAKSLGGGIMPIGATITTPAVWDKAYGSLERATLHTSTFGGNSWACAAGLAAIEAIIEQKLCENASEMGEYFLSELRKLQEKYHIIADVRGKGLFIGIEFRQPVSGFIDRLTAGTVNKFAGEYSGALVAGELRNKYGIITAYTLNNPNVIRMEPPLIVEKEQIDRVIAALTDIFEQHKSIFKLAMTGSKTVLGSYFNRK